MGGVTSNVVEKEGVLSVEGFFTAAKYPSFDPFDISSASTIVIGVFVDGVVSQRAFEFSGDGFKPGSTKGNETTSSPNEDELPEAGGSCKVCARG